MLGTSQIQLDDSIDDHLELLNIGSNTHVQLDAHLADNSQAHSDYLLNNTADIGIALTLQGATLVPLTLDNLAGIQNILEVKDNGSPVFVIADGGFVGLGVASNTGKKLGIAHTYSAGAGWGLYAEVIADAAMTTLFGAETKAISSHSSGTVTGIRGYEGGVSIESGGTVGVAIGLKGKVTAENALTPTVSQMIGIQSAVDVEDATVTVAIGIHGQDPGVDTGSIARSWAGLFEGDVQVNSNQLLILEGSINSKGNSYLVFNSATTDIDLFVDGTQVQTWDNDAINLRQSTILEDTKFLVFDKASGNGIKVDEAASTFGWRDLLGGIRTRGVGATDPADAVYAGNIKAYQFAVNDECWVDYHIPHDYVKGTDIYLHFHWSHNSTVVTGGSVTWGADIIYAKGHNQAAFSVPVNTTVVGNASTTRYQHIITEIQVSASSPSASQIDTDDLEPDGVIMIRGYLSANNITSSGAVPDPFLHFKDIHYQSTNIATKAKAPDFYA